MGTDNIVKYLRTAYSDEKLAALLAHTQDGKLGYGSCCCFMAIPTADHALQDPIGITTLAERGVDTSHYARAKSHPLAVPAEYDFLCLGKTHAERREALLPLIEAEIKRREDSGMNTWSAPHDLLHLQR